MLESYSTGLLQKEARVLPNTLQYKTNPTRRKWPAQVLIQRYRCCKLTMNISVHKKSQWQNSHETAKHFSHLLKSGYYEREKILSLCYYIRLSQTTSCKQSVTCSPESQDVNILGAQSLEKFSASISFIFYKMTLLSFLNHTKIM